MKLYPRSWTRCQIVSGSVLIAAGIFLLVFVPWQIKQLIYTTFSLASPTSEGVEGFVERRADAAAVYNAYYIWNVTNPDDVTDRGADPILVEVGPYTYRQRIVRAANDLRWHANGTLEYVERCEYIFRRDRSIGDPAVDTYTTVNLGYVGALHQTRDDSIKHGAVNLMISTLKIKLFVPLTVDQLLWGYKNPLLEVLALADKTINPTIRLQVKSNFNDTAILPAAILTGGGATEGVGLRRPGRDEQKQMTMWRGMHGSLIGMWGSEHANRIEGTDGTSFHPYFEEDEEPRVFVDSLFRSTTFGGCGSVRKDGVLLYCIKLRDDMLKSAAIVPENAGYFMKTTGFIPLPPSLGQPIHISLPRFHRANWSDPLANKIKFVPDNHESDAYDTRLYVEPFTGQVMDAHKRLQINTLFEPSVTVPATAPATYLPIVYIDQSPVVAESTINTFKIRIYLPYYAAIVLGSLCIIGGFFLTVVAIVRCTCFGRESKHDVYEHHYGVAYRAIPRDSFSDGQSLQSRSAAINDD